MKRISKIIFTLAICFICCNILPAVAASENIRCEYPVNSLYFEVPADTIILTSDLDEYDDRWAAAQVTSPKAKLKEFENMGTIAAYYNPATGITVNYLVKHTSETVKAFSFEGMSDQEIKDYVAGQMAGIDNLELSVDIIPHGDIKFFRLELHVTAVNAPATEIVYGTLINGQMIQFDIYEDGSAPVDESFIRSIIDSLTFTRIMTPEEYAELSSKGFRKFLGIIGAVILVFVLLIVIAKANKKRELNKAKKISEAMQDFRVRKNAGEVDTTSPASIIAVCEYNKDTINDFGIFNTWIKDIIRIAIGVIILAVIAIVMLNSDSLLYAIITLAIGVIVLYITYTRGEKTKEALAKQYPLASKPVATYRFFEEYFIVTGISSPVEYIYKQISSIRTYSHYIYIYVGSDTALIIDTDKTDNPGALKDFIKARI